MSISSFIAEFSFCFEVYLRLLLLRVVEFSCVRFSKCIHYAKYNLLDVCELQANKD